MSNKIAAATKTKKSLVWLGAACLLVFVVGLAVSYFVGKKEKVVGHPASTQTVTFGTTASTTTVQANQTTTTTGSLSDAMLEAILGTGAILVIVGLLYGRITTIKLFGSEIDLSTDEVKKTAAAAQKVADAANAPPDARAGITATALAHARDVKTAIGAPLSNADITAAVEEAARGYLHIVGSGT
jgi:hypothetical protein